MRTEACTAGCLKKYVCSVLASTDSSQTGESHFSFLFWSGLFKPLLSKLPLVGTEGRGGLVSAKLPCHVCCVVEKACESR